MRSIGLYVLIGGFLVGVAFGTLRVRLVPLDLPQPFQPLIGNSVTLTGTVVALPDVRETSDRLTVEVESAGARTRIIASAPLYPPAHAGDIVRVSGPLKKPAPFDADGGRIFPYDQFLRKDGVYAVMQPAGLQIIGQRHSAWLLMLRMLGYVTTAFNASLARALPEPESSLATGILIGGKQGLGTKLIDDFTAAGMLQIVVLSGYNVMIVANGILKSLSFLPKRFASSIAMISIALFVLAGGAGASAVRAGIMAWFAILARANHKNYDVVRILTVALLLLVLWKPLSLVYDPGLQFSFLATLGLIAGSSLLMARLTFIRHLVLREMFATTIAAQLGVLPLLLWQSGNLSLVALFANIAAMPVIPFAMASSALAGLLSFPLGFLHGSLPLLAGLPAYLSLWYVIHIATVSSALPYANLILPKFSFWLVIVSYAGLALAVWRLQKEPDAVRRRALASA